MADDTSIEDVEEGDLENESFPGVPESVEKFSAWTNKTAVRGTFNIAFPWVGGSVIVKWPASGRQAMLEIAAVCFALAIVVPATMYIIFVGASSENISSFGRLVGSSTSSGAHKPDEYRAPERIQVKTNDGIEIIEACPPCAETDCGEDCPCPTCPMCPPPIMCPPSADAAAAEKVAPLSQTPIL